MTHEFPLTTTEVPSQLLAEICEEAASIEPRWVLADWLEERGDPRGRFIRSQLQLEERAVPSAWDRTYPFPHDYQIGWQNGRANAREVDEPDELAGLERTVGNLLQRNRCRWDRQLRRWAQHCWYRNGFVEHIRITLSSFLEHSDEIFRLAPIRAVTIVGDTAGVAALQQCPQVARLEGLGFRGGWLGYSGADALAACRYLRDLKYLEVPNNGWGVEALRRVLASHHLQQLEGLDLDRNPDVGRRGAAHLLEMRPEGGLKRLLLRGCGISSRFTRAMSAWPGLSGVTLLDLRQNGITIAGYDALFTSPFWKRSTRVRLGDREHQVLTKKLGNVYQRPESF